MPSLCQAVAIGDAHLGPNARQADRLAALDAIIAFGLQLPSLGAWLWPGDVFHAKSTIADRNELAPRLIRMAKVAPVIGCRGNHDAPGDLAIFERLETTWPVYFPERPEVLRVATPTGHTLYVFALPWPEEGGLALAGLAPGDVPAAARQALSTIFIDAGHELARVRGEGALTAFIGHCTVVGAVSSSGQPVAGLGIEIDAEHLAHLGDCPKICNHIHKPQTVSGAVYVGSICRLDFGEREEKRFLLTQFCEEPLWNPFIEGLGWSMESHPIDVAPMWHVNGWLTREGFLLDPYQPLPVDSVHPWRGCEVRVRAQFHNSERAILDLAKAKLLADFAEAKALQLELVAVPDGGLRAPQVATAQTLREKLLAWAEASGTVVPAAALEKLTALETSEGDQVVACTRALAESLLAAPVAAEPVGVAL